MTCIKRQSPDFIIVDLHLNKNQNGFDFINKIQDFFIPIIIITGFPKETQTEEFVKLGVRHYLTKPVDSSSLDFVFRKMIKELDEGKKQEDILVVRDKGSLIKVPCGSILKLEIDGNYVTVELFKGKRYILKSSLLKIQARLDAKKFVRCHRSTIVNFDYVTGLDTNRKKLLLRNMDEVSVGNRFQSSIKNLFRDQKTE